MLWNYNEYPRVELALNTAGRLILRHAKPNAPEANVFTKDQEQVLWRTILKSGLDVDASSVTLFDGLQDNGRLKAAEASLTRESGTALAYEAWQLTGFKPVKIEMRVNYGKPQLAVMSVERAAPVRNGRTQAPVLQIERVEEKGANKQASKPQGKIARAD